MSAWKVLDSRTCFGSFAPPFLFLDEDGDGEDNDPRWVHGGQAQLEKRKLESAMKFTNNVPQSPKVRLISSLVVTSNIFHPRSASPPPSKRPASTFRG